MINNKNNQNNYSKKNKIFLKKTYISKNKFKLLLINMNSKFKVLITEIQITYHYYKKIYSNKYKWLIYYLKKYNNRSFKMIKKMIKIIV